MINGINMAGCCLGAVVMSPVVQYLVDEYGASGMFLILAAIVLNCVPACIVLKNPRNEEIKLVSKPKEHEKPVPDVSIISETNTHFENLGFVSDEEKQNGELQSARINVIDKHMKTNTNDKSIEDIPNVKDHEFCIDQNEKNLSTLSKLNNSEQVHYFPIEKKQKDFQRSSDVELVRFSEKIKFEEHAPNKDNDSELCRTEYEIECKNQNELRAVNKKTPKANNKKPVSWQLKHLFTDPAFYCIMIVNSLHAFVNTLNWAVIMDFGIDKGIHPDLSLYFVMFLPVAEMIGNLSLNWVVDRKFMTRANYAALCFVILGLDSEFIEWSYNFILTLIAVMIYGFVSGAVRSTFPGMIYDSIDKDKQSMAMASRFLPYGLLCFAKAPVVGYFRGTLGSYKGVYYLLMAFSFVSAFFSFLTPVVKSFVDKKKKIPNE
ncbi:monocarboxylate transporter 5-like [Parasteatoda tepidariorum]|uniref:monocarboxylate transporter 5-like n=1 Tax=Parasteatoda tepidariorum TaxID=114398 RepID=UPI0039BC8616